MAPSTRGTLQVTSAFLGTLREKLKYDQARRCPKTSIIEGYNTQFRTFLEHELRTPREAS